MKALVPCHCVDPEVGVEVVGERVPGDGLPSHALLQALDLGLGGARDERERRVPRVQVRGVRDLVGQEGAADAGPLRVRAAAGRIRGDVRRVEGAVDDQLATALEQVGEARRAVRVLRTGSPSRPPSTASDGAVPPWRRGPG